MGQACCNAENPTQQQDSKRKHRRITSTAGGVDFEDSHRPLALEPLKKFNLKTRLITMDDSEGSPVRDASTHLTDKDGAQASKNRIVTVSRIDTETDFMDTDGQDEGSNTLPLNFDVSPI